MKNLEIDLVSFVHGLSGSQRLKLTQKVINCSESNILLFSGHTLMSNGHIERLMKGIENKHSEVFLELEDINSSKINNCMYRLSQGKLENLYTNQLFTSSNEIENNNQLADRLLNELISRRFLKIHGYKILIIQCGELNILRNLQGNSGERNKVEFRVDVDGLLNRFEELFRSVDIFFNPIHTPMGNQGKMEKRRQFLSSKGRYYFSASNTRENSSNLNLKGLQYAFFNGKSMKEIKSQFIDDSIVRTFQITKQ